MQSSTDGQVKFFSIDGQSRVTMFFSLSGRRLLLVGSKDHVNLINYSISQGIHELYWAGSPRPFIRQTHIGSVPGSFIQPQLYQNTQLSLKFNGKVFWKMFINSIFHSFMLFFLTFLCYTDMDWGNGFTGFASEILSPNGQIGGYLYIGKSLSF